MSWENDIASSIPGTELKIQLRRLRVPQSFAKLNTSYYSILSMLTLGSISIAKRLSMPLIGVGQWVTFWSKQSLRLWAGSVEMIRVLRCWEARRVARLLLVVVFPTPPFPPTNIHRRDFWSRIFLRVPGNIFSGCIPITIREINKYQIIFSHMSLVIEDADATFKHIHRILNTNIDGKRTVPFALDKIKGVGRRFGFLICKILRINPRIRAGELTEKDCDGIASIINDPEGHGVPRWFLNRQRDYKEGKNLQVASNNLETKLREDIERLFKIRSNKGLRHKWNLKVRGQHTKTTGRRGKTVGVERKKK